MLQCVAGCCNAQYLMMVFFLQRFPSLLLAVTSDGLAFFNNHMTGALQYTLDTSVVLDQVADPGTRVLERIAVCCNVSQCVAVYRSVLQCVAVYCSVLQCVAVCCSVLQCVAVCCSVLLCVVVCCSVLPYVAVCCSVVQCGAAWCSVL